jgi:hypothetical protein
MRVTQGMTRVQRLMVYDAAAGLDDAFVIFGDSITMLSVRFDVATAITERLGTLTGGSHRPFVENAGIGFDKMNGAPPSSYDTDARVRLTDYLPLFPGRYVGLAYGTNDSVNNTSEIGGFKAALRTCLDKIIVAGKVPLVATIPWGVSGDSVSALQKNGYIQEVLAEPAYLGKVVPGPDLYGFFSQPANQHFITDNDGIHPSLAGQDEWRRLWAEAIYHNVYLQ